MKSAYIIDFRHSTGNLHIYLRGDFTGMCAWELVKTLKWHAPGSGRIFISTGNLASIDSGAVAFFKEHLKAVGISPDKLFFKGPKGFQLAPNGSKVLICRPPCTDAEDYDKAPMVRNDRLRVIR
jgi:hypothetical protein